MVKIRVRGSRGLFSHGVGDLSGISHGFVVYNEGEIRNRQASPVSKLQ